MKNIIIIIFFLISIKGTYAQTTQTQLDQSESIKQFVGIGKSNINKHALDNLLHGLKSENTGVLKYCIYFSGKYKVGKAVNPLVRILNSSSTNEDLKILTALSLYEIRSDDGMYSIYHASKFGSSERLKRKCFLLYNSFVLNKKVKS
jgi:HEAT repeat protein